MWGAMLLATASACKDGYRGLDADLECCKEAEKKLRSAEGVREAVLSLLLVMLLKSKCDPAQLAWKAVDGLPLLWPVADTALLEEGYCPDRLIHCFHEVRAIVVDGSHASLINSRSACLCDVYSPMGSWLFNSLI